MGSLSLAVGSWNSTPSALGTEKAGKGVMNRLRCRPLCSPLKSCLQRIHLDSVQQTQFPLHSTAASFPSIFVSNRLLDDLSKSGRVDEARQLFDQMPCRDDFSWNTMISAYARLGRLTEARQLFDQTPTQTSITWSALISGHARQGDGLGALELFCQMRSDGLQPNQYTLGSVLRACSVSFMLRRGEQIHAHAIKTRFDLDIFVVTGLVDMYAKCQQILDAEYLFNMMPDKKNHVLWTAMVTGYSQNNYELRAMQCFRDMRAEGVRSNQFTFPSVLTACAALLERWFGMQVHGCIIRTGFGVNVFVESALLDMYAKCGDLNSARRVLESMEVEDIVSWNSLIVGCVRQGFEREAISLFKKMHMRNMKIDDFTYPSVLNSLASVMDVEHAKCVHCLIVKTGFEAYKHVSNALIDVYAKQGNLNCAFSVFHRMPEQDVVSWTSLITGYAHHGFYENALKLFCNMRIVGIDPDQFVIASILSACAELTILEFGRQVHANFIRCGLKSSLSVDNSLVTMYAKCGCIEDAHQVFDSMLMRDVVSWTALIVGHAQNGRGEHSLKLYDQMILNGIRPDYVTFIGLLFACSHAGLVEDGCRYFESMGDVHGITPGPEHYACMIDLLGRSGKIAKAKEILEKMTIRPDATVWKAMLAACRIHGNLELGERAAMNLFELEPANAVPYVLLCNMFSAAGRWDDAASIRKLMKSRGICKEPGCSWMEINSKVHTFTAEDRSHSRMSEIYSKVDEIMSLIKEAGYVPDMNFALHDMDEEGKELGLTYHSEKLAVAFGLLSVPRGAPIRIFKNLRVCGDCHTAIKFISRVFQRHIILRDSNCFHHFSEGRCSCRDYW
ncbi:PREDICTED: pentatricopeptide repeat-containing protein At4g21065 [Nelumbo nucifera]|uniref:DYW domain-containing protein n=2 Tax=Nelumbo nucifera TaxID=4432 RepID=A0A822XBN2_NELNU|nr:PREDICTED: pentatricopeptide repeat-containing protein At4g21065 [Nelumbo nucifera]DAD18814.1 TPA_asm: hypothetical protein HUJ06_020277 [Nelumbo nucifera]